MVKREGRPTLEGATIEDKLGAEFHTPLLEGWRRQQRHPAYQQVLAEVDALKERMRHRRIQFAQEVDVDASNAPVGEVEKEIADAVYHATYHLIGITRDVLGEPELVSRLEPICNQPSRLTAVQGRLIQRMALVLEQLQLPGQANFSKSYVTKGYFIRNSCRE